MQRPFPWNRAHLVYFGIRVGGCILMPVCIAQLRGVSVVSNLMQWRCPLFVVVEQCLQATSYIGQC